jgi:hypothetical protein
MSIQQPELESRFGLTEIVMLRLPLVEWATANEIAAIRKLNHAHSNGGQCRTTSFVTVRVFKIGYAALRTESGDLATSTLRRNSMRLIFDCPGVRARAGATAMSRTSTYLFTRRVAPTRFDGSPFSEFSSFIFRLPLSKPAHRRGVTPGREGATIVASGGLHKLIALRLPASHPP